jgi:hypothetical protein
MAARIFFRSGQRARGQERYCTIGLVFVILGALPNGCRLRM